jgi:hypothetical protein
VPDSEQAVETGESRLVEDLVDQAEILEDRNRLTVR